MSDKKRSNKRKTTGQFIEEADEIHHGKYEYSKVNYINKSTKIIITCTKDDHGDFLKIRFMTK